MFDTNEKKAFLVLIICVTKLYLFITKYNYFNEMRITKTNLVVLLMAVAVLSTAFSTRIADVYTVNSASSSMAWVGKNVAGGGHDGTIGISQGHLVFEGDKLTGGSFTVDINSISVTDLEGARATRLENHLKNEDFFDAPKFPQASFVITNVSGGTSRVTVTGNLTIKGITKSISFPATITKNGTHVRAVATDVAINRTEFGVKYRSGNFFSGLGDRAILDEFTLSIDLRASK